MDLLDKKDLPQNFEYPQFFLEFVMRNVKNIEPWKIIEGAELKNRYEGVINRYHKIELIPFARRIDNDDVACWDSNHSGSIVIIHDFASHGWEQRKVFDNFNDWMRSVEEDIKEYDL